MFELNFENFFSHSAVCGLQIDSTRKPTSPTTTSVLFDRIKAGLGFDKFTERTNVTAPPEKGEILKKQNDNIMTDRECGSIMRE